MDKSERATVVQALLLLTDIVAQNDKQIAKSQENQKLFHLANKGDKENIFVTRWKEHVKTQIINEYNLNGIEDNLSENERQDYGGKKEMPLKYGQGSITQRTRDYYVIDCGWHNEEDGWMIYPYVGQWKESKKRFPNGIKHILDYIHNLGMKAGLWIEPEVIGYLCKEMLNYYDDDCFFKRNGKG
jgi:hypothetical protein